MSGDEATLVRQYKEAERNARWLAVHYVEVRKRASGRFVVISKQTLAGVGDDPDEALRAAGFTSDQAGQVLIDYIAADGESWIL